MPWTRSGKCVYKKKADGSQGKKKGCSDSEEKAKKHMSKLYSLDETDLDETDPMFLGGGGAEEEEEDPMGEALVREWVRQTLLLSEASLGGKTGLFKYKSRARKVRDKIVSGDPLALAKGSAATGETFVIVRNKDEIVQLLNDIMAVHDKAGGRATAGNGFAEKLSDDPLYKKINDLLDQSAIEIGGLSLGKLHKSKDLGGKESGESVACEDQQIVQMRAEIDKLKPISIKLGSIVIDGVTGIVSVPSTPKADAALVDVNGNQIAWISLKCANSGKDMQQWGGISELQSSDITQFVKDLVTYVSVNGRLTTVMWRRIQDSSLAKRAVWGLDAGSGDFGIENLHTLISTKGQIGLSEISDGLYEFAVGAGEIHHGGAMPTGTFEPMLAASYRAERGAGLGLTDVRVGIYPAGYRSMTSKGEELPVSSGAELEVIPLEAQEETMRLAAGKKTRYYAQQQLTEIKHQIIKETMRRRGSAPEAEAIADEWIMLDPSESKLVGDLGEDLAAAFYPGGQNLNDTKSNNFPFADIMVGTDVLSGQLLSVKSSTRERGHPLAQSEVHLGRGNSAPIETMVNGKGTAGFFDEIVAGLSPTQKQFTLTLGIVAIKPVSYKAEKPVGLGRAAAQDAGWQENKMNVALQKYTGRVAFQVIREAGTPVKFRVKSNRSVTRSQLTQGSIKSGNKATERFPNITTDIIATDITTEEMTQAQAQDAGETHTPGRSDRALRKQRRKELKDMMLRLDNEQLADMINYIRGELGEDYLADGVIKINRSDQSQVLRTYAKSQVRLMETSRYAKSQVGLLKERLIIEELTGTDRSDIKRMIKKEIEGTTNKREIEKAFNKKFDVELKKALGTSFLGTPGKINKFVVDQIYDEVHKWLADTATRNEIAEITKQVIIKLYRELSFSSPAIINRIKI